MYNVAPDKGMIKLNMKFFTMEFEKLIISETQFPWRREKNNTQHI